jgi:hypothetical protein
MAKSQRKAMKARSTAVSSVIPLRNRLAEKVVVVLDVAKESQVIVGQILAHFAAGYSAQRQSETPGSTPTNPTIFKKPSVFAGFHAYLLNSTMTNFMDIHWDDPAAREQTLLAAFEHGKLARTRVVDQELSALTLGVIFETLEEIKPDFCPSGSGGGGACD